MDQYDDDYFIENIIDIIKENPNEVGKILRDCIDRKTKNYDLYEKYRFTSDLGFLISCLIMIKFTYVAIFLEVFILYFAVKLMKIAYKYKLKYDKLDIIFNTFIPLMCDADNGL